MNITDKRHHLTKKLLLNISSVTLTNCICNGMSSVFLAAIINTLGGTSRWLGGVIGFQSILGVMIFLPQASFIKRIGENTCIKIGMALNTLSYTLYFTLLPFGVSLGKFIEGLADRLMNSSVSKLLYDATDGKNNRGKFGLLSTGTILTAVIRIKSAKYKQ